jgi:hypothetical protein
MQLQLELGKLLDPYQQAQIANLQSETEYNQARSAAALMNPALSGSDVTESVVQGNDGQFHNVLVNKITGETIRDLGLASPKDAGVPTALEQAKTGQEVQALKNQNQLSLATIQDKIQQQQLQTKRDRLSVIEQSRNLRGRLSPDMEREAAQLKLDMARVEVAQGKADLDMTPLKSQLLDAQIAETRAKIDGASDATSKATTLRQEFNSSLITKNYQTIQYAQNLMSKARQEAAKGNRVAADQTLGVMFQKMLDPTSVVRESEYARTPEGVALLNRIESILPQIMKGGLTLSDDDRDAIMTMSTKALESAGAIMNDHMERYGQLADEYKVPRKLVFGNMKPFDVAGTQTTTTGQPSPQGNAASPYINMARQKGATDQDIANLQTILQSGDQERIRKAIERIQGQ